ncbi:DNA replication initiation factor cdc45 [Malassezia vespertilionis]|uniref:Cdc45p n=1 Tax=Malassezia vespertilionis TaxID=2020962 RepID=A0A2N1JGA5_9BASI|nr:DNA replication initiation factor cdc45 [Malassezia vespertilionis]PKI85569.1 hypothetical protein MVES_000660 [Malassezia vespertilionis]WFD05376.1 DNA replication initiation factor cdc45 [Malassezia vespertilionis]
MVIVNRPRETGDTYSHPLGGIGFVDAYRSICRSARKRVLGTDTDTFAPGGTAVLILATPAVDSLASVRIFTRLLAEDEIAFRVAPVNGYRSLQQVLAEDVEGHKELHTLVFINFGSLLPLPETIPLPPHCTLHIIDSHRPWNLSNLFATSQMNDRIHVWDDGEIAERLGREREAYEMLEFDVDSGSEESDSDADGSDHDTPASQNGKRPRSEDDGASPKRSRMDSEQRQFYRATLAKYYSRGAWSGMGAAQLMYMLAVSLGRSDRDNLWYAILGLTAQYITNAIHSATYDGYAAALASDVIAMNADATSAETRGLQDVNFHGADDSSVRVVPHELRFTLYKHWSLETSMYHTSYVAAKLGIWREKGISKLRGLLAKMGLSLANCRQIYAHMDLDLRKSLVQRMESIAPEYGMSDIVYRSFTRSFGFRFMPISAADAVEGISALLQAAHGVRIEVEGVQIVRTDTTLGSARNADTKADRGAATYGARELWNLEDTGVHTSMRGKDLHGDTRDDTVWENNCSALWVQNFFEAYRAMDVHKTQNLELLHRSLQLAKALHQAIVAQGVSIIVKQSIKTLRSFRLTVLQEGPYLNLFAHSDTLTRLGLWLIDALRDIVTDQSERRAAARRASHRNKGESLTEIAEQQHALQSLPFVLAALDASRDVFVVVGLVGAPEYGDTSRNRFGLAFQEACTASGARMRNDRFDASVLEIKREDLLLFVEALHLKA